VKNVKESDESFQIVNLTIIDGKTRLQIDGKMASESSNFGWFLVSSGIEFYLMPMQSQ
jgi:hypothetical protein